MPTALRPKSPRLALKLAPSPSVAAYSSLIVSMPKRCRNTSHTSGRMPLLHAMRTLCCRSSGEGGALTRYRHSSPTYWRISACEARTSGQKVRWLNLRDSTTVEPAKIEGVIHSPCAAPWYSGRHVYILFCGVSRRFCETLREVLSSRLRHMTTPLGRPVVPEV